MKIIRFINVISEKLLATVVMITVTILFSDSLLFPRFVVVYNREE